MIPWHGAKQLSLFIRYILNLRSHIHKGSIIHYTSKVTSIVHMEITNQFVKSYTKSQFVYNHCTLGIDPNVFN